MSILARERVYIYAPLELITGVTDKITQQNQFNPDLGLGPQITHDFIAWGLKKAFSDITGFMVDSFTPDSLCNNWYAEFSFVFEQYMFSVVKDIGVGLTGDLRYNLVLTYQTLYVIAY